MAEDKNKDVEPNANEPVSGKKARQSHEDVQVKRQVDASHAANDYTQIYGRELSDEEFKRRLESGGLMLDSVMPSPPEVPGYDTIWGTTMADSQNQLRWMLSNGYSFVTQEEAPHYRNQSARTAGFDGVIGYNELVALKIKKGRREQFAKLFHHDKPLAMEASIRSQMSALSDNAKHNVKVNLEEGMRTMGQAPKKPPSFNL